MIEDINLLFNPETKEYVIVSGGNSLVLNEKDFKAIKKSMNGITYALQMKSRKLREEARARGHDSSARTNVNRIC